MLPVGMLLTFGGYGVVTWGYILVKGYNITLTSWFSPLHPFTGSLSKAGTIPPTQVFPGGSGATSGATPLSPVQKQQLKNLKGAAPNPHGTVQ